MSGIGDPPPGSTPPPSATPPPDWPDRDLATTEPGWDVKVYGNRRRATTAEQAVPWLIGLVLALAGILIVLLALVFSSTDGLLPSYGSPSPSPTTAMTPPPPTPTPDPTPDASPSLEPTPTPEPTPAFAPLEIIFMQRTSGSGPTHLYSHDFATQASPEPLARDNRGVDQYAWAPDGSVGIALVDSNPLALTPGSSARDLGDGFDGIAFASDSLTAWGVRATRAGASDRIELLRVDFPSGGVQVVKTWTHPHPVTYQESAVQEAQFADDGGFNRVYVLDDGRVVVWILGAPAVYTWDPATATAGTTTRQPVLSSPNGQFHVVLTESGSNTRITVRGLADEERGALNVSGLVSHLRWAANSNQVAFTINRGVSGGGVSQDLYLWDLQTGSSAVRLTQDARSRGGEFRGVENRWKP